MNNDGTNFHDGYWQFDQDLAFDPNDPATYPSFFIGNVGGGPYKMPIWNVGVFVQDTWQARDALTLTLGVRYDVDRSVTAGNQYIDAKNARVIATYGGSAPLEKIRVDYNNVAPRVGVVWAPTADKRTSVRGALGLFYDQNHGNFNAIYITNTLVSDGQPTINCNTPAQNPFWDPSDQAAGMASCRSWLAQDFPYFPDLSQAPAATQRLLTVDPGLQVPYTLQISGGVAHEFPNGLALSADVIHARGSGLEYMDVNGRPMADGSVETLDPRFSGIFELQRVGFTHYTALQAKLQYRQKAFYLASSYTLSRAISNLTSGNIFGSGPANPFDLGEDLGPDDTDIRHNLVVNGSYVFPLEFQVAGIFTYRSGFPWSVTTFENPTGAYYPPRIEPKNSRRGDSQCTLDLRLSRVFRLGSRVQASIFWEMFNALNTLNYTAYDTLHESPTFGYPVAAADMRRQQLGFRVNF